MIDLGDITARLDEYLDTGAIPDYPNARNGLQVDREGPIGRVAFAVDAAQATIEEAARRGADLLIVHHGLFWGGLRPLVGPHYVRVRTLIRANLAVYSSHLPLDVHPEVGNNALLARELGVRIEGRFGDYGGTAIGVWGTLDMRREALAARLDQVLGCRIRMIPGGPERVGKVGIITGGAGSQVGDAIAASLDAFITGEVAHHNFFDAMEGGINLYLGGHYATEVWGVRALANFVSKEFGVECFFIEHPTGL
ncbi:MAG TPA: Nif3-like dinuclear metal center hexameric protein [Longimicrobiaceae bacterium]|nr:Nif3-like dinuclear metal center hexameric protein [Longimicrobiaceae bacterium]